MLGAIHFWGSFICINIVFMPMFIQGLGGMNRRMYDGGMQYAHNKELLKYNVIIGMAAWTLGLFQIPFIINFFMSIKWGKPVDNNPWEATTLEWSAPSPPGHGNFLTEPIVYRGPYEYSVPGAAKRLHADVRAGEGVADGHEHSVHGRRAARHRADQRQARDLAVPGVRSDAVRRAVLDLHHPAHGRAGMAARRAERRRSARSTPSS